MFMEYSTLKLVIDIPNILILKANNKNNIKYIGGIIYES